MLFLSKNLKKYRYGPEYASLEVKDHLEPVKFSDLVDAVMILLVHLNHFFVITLPVIMLFIIKKYVFTFCFADMADVVYRQQKRAHGLLTFI